MSLTACSCNGTGGNTGLASCLVHAKASKRFVFVEYFKEDGSVNGLTLSDFSNGVFTQTDLEALVQNLDPKLRWYPTPILENVVNERADEITEEAESTTSVFIREGSRSVEAQIWEGSEVLLANLEKFECKTVGFFIIDAAGNLRGDNSVEGQLRPIRIQNQSLRFKFMEPTETTVAKVMVNFTVSELMRDSQIRMIESSKITADFIDIKGLLTVVNEDASSIDTDGFQVKLNTEFGGVTNKLPAEGLDEDDFYVYNVTDESEVTVTVTESSTDDGLYTFVYSASVTAGDVIRVSNKTTGTLDKSFDINTFTVNTPT